jgi:hypothetical protein
MPLTDKQISALKPEAKSRKFFDGGGKLWRLKYRVNGVEKRISLRAYPEVSLKDARAKAFELRKTVHEGLDPSVERRRAKARARRSLKNNWPTNRITVCARYITEPSIWMSAGTCSRGADYLDELRAV